MPCSANWVEIIPETGPESTATNVLSHGQSISLGARFAVLKCSKSRLNSSLTLIVLFCRNVGRLHLRAVEALDCASANFKLRPISNHIYPQRFSIESSKSSDHKRRQKWCNEEKTCFFRYIASNKPIDYRNKDVLKALDANIPDVDTNHQYEMNLGVSLADLVEGHR